MGVSAAVVGASGYAGGELLRLLDAHPEFTITAAVANRRAGQPVAAVHPNLMSLADLSFVAPQEFDGASVDLVFLSLPSGESAGVVAGIPEGTRVVDLGADFRLHDSRAWSQFYGGPHAGAWTYGLPELPGVRAKIATSTRVANPGCYATAIILGFAPLLSAGLVSGPAASLSAVASSGVSGAGREPDERLLAAEVINDLSVYKMAGTHRHIPEIVQALSHLAASPPKLSFTPVLAPMPRGILAVCATELLPGTTTATVQEAFDSSYSTEAFVHVLTGGQWPRTSSVVGSNSVHIQAAVEDGSDRAVVVSVLDNLIKGAAGQAIQNANLMFGFEETLGLCVNGLAP